MASSERSYRHLIYALVSVACPFIALGVISIYQEYAYADFWRPHEGPIDDANVNAGAMMGFVVIVEAILAIGIGSLVGLVFAGLSLKHRARIFSFGTAALIFNMIPIFGVLTIYIRGRL